MSMLDQAFVRAYSRSRTSAPAAPVPSATNPTPSVPTRSQAADVTADGIWQPVQFGAGGIDESYFRVDVGHMPMQRAQPNPVSVGASSVPREPRRPMPAALSHTLTAFDDVAGSHEAEAYTRIDRPHPHHAPNAKPSQANPIQANPIQANPIQANEEEPIHYQRINLQTDEALAFAIAKAEALRPSTASQPAKKNLASTIMQDLAEARVLQQTIAAQNEEEQRRQELELIADQNRLAQLERLEKFTRRPSPAAPKPFNAVWEVDAFEFSDVVVRLFGQASLLDSIGSPLDQAVANGLKSILITSQARGVGRTSVAIGIAVAAASAGLNVALVDADLSTGGLADSLRLEVAQDWLSAMRSGLPLDEAAVKSIEDQLTVLPINASGPGTSASAEEFDTMMRRLRSQFDLVVVDGAPWGASLISLHHVTTLDAAIVVVDAKTQDTTALHAMQLSLKESGIQGLGLVENFS